MSATEGGRSREEEMEGTSIDIRSAMCEGDVVESERVVECGFHHRTGICSRYGSEECVEEGYGRREGRKRRRGGGEIRMRMK